MTLERLVWLTAASCPPPRCCSCAGQSNMVMAVGAMDGASAEITSADAHPTIRVFTVGQRTKFVAGLKSHHYTIISTISP